MTSNENFIWRSYLQLIIKFKVFLSQSSNYEREMSQGTYKNSNSTYDTKINASKKIIQVVQWTRSVTYEFKTTFILECVILKNKYNRLNSSGKKFLILWSKETLEVFFPEPRKSRLCRRFQFLSVSWSDYNSCSEFAIRIKKTENLVNWAYKPEAKLSEMVLWLPYPCWVNISQCQSHCVHTKAQTLLNPPKGSPTS